MQLQQLLRKVVTAQNGTGNVFQTLAYEVAGKSGTAETAREKDGEQLHHKWFAGYFPFNNPKYALVVVNLDVPSDEGGSICYLVISFRWFTRRIKLTLIFQPNKNNSRITPVMI